MAIRDADVVLTIGGGEETYQAGLAAIIAHKKLVPIASFGGASERLYEALETLSEPTERADLRTLNNPWSNRVLETALRIAGIGRSLQLLIAHGHSDERYKLEVWLRNQGGMSDITEMQDVVGIGQTLPEKFERLALRADAAIAIVTPDDLGGAANESTQSVVVKEKRTLS